MSPKIYTRKIKAVVIKYHECNHTIKETKDHFKVTSASFFVGFSGESVIAQPERNGHIDAINAATSRVIFLFIKHASFFTYRNNRRVLPTILLMNSDSSSRLYLPYPSTTT